MHASDIRLTSKRLSSNRTTKRGKEKSPCDGHSQCEKEMDDHWRVNKFLKESNVVTDPAQERVSFLIINDINDISSFRTLECHHYCSMA
jgi:hypothetical protein